MPDQKISDLGDGGAPQPTDDFVVARGGTNNKLAWSSLSAAATAGNIAVTAAGNTAGALALVSSGTLTLAGGNGVTLSQAGNAITISGATAAGGTQTFIGGISASDTLYTSGTVRLTGVGGGVTVSSNTGQRVDISVAAPVAQTVQTQNLHNVTLSGNTSGVMAQISSGTLTLAGGNNITVSQNGNAVTISGANVGGAQTGISGIAASNTTYTSGSVTFTGVGGGVTVSSNTGQRVDISVAAQSVQPETQTFIGGISASNTLYTSGSVRFTGSQAVTVRSGTGQLVVIDAPAQSVQPETQTFIAGIQNSQTTYTSGTVNLSVVAGNLTIRSTTGQAFQFSASQTVQPETQTFLGALAASNTTYTSGTVTITGVGGGITVSSNTGQRIDLSVAAQTTQTQGILSAGVSTGGNTAGNTQVSTGSRLVFVGSNGITASQGTAAGATTITLSGVTQTVQTQNMVAVTLSGNTSGAQALISSGTLTLAGGNNITVSQAGNAVTISGPNVGGAQTGISGLANSETTYTSGSVTLSALGAVTIRSTTGQHFQISVNSQTAQTQSLIQALYDGANSITTGTVRLTNANGVTFSVNAQTLSASVNESISMFAVSNTTQSTSGTAHKSALSFGGAGIASVGVTGGSVVVSVPAGAGQTGISGIANSQTTYTSGTVSLSELGAITIRSTTGNQYQLSVNAQSVQPETQTFLAGIQNSQTTYTSGTVNLSVVAGNLTIRSTTGQAFQFSASQSVQPETQTAISGIANSQTTYTSGTVSLSELGAITIRSTTGNQFQLSVNAQTTQTQGILSAGVSTGGNTLGNTTVNTGSRLVFVGTNNITLSQGTAAGATTITISGPSGGAETQTAISGIANSQTTYTSGTVSLSELGAITIRSTTGNQFQFSVNAQSVQPETQTFIGGIANSQTTYTSGTVSLSELGAITIRSTTGNQYQLSVNAQTTQTQGILSAGVSNVGNTAGQTTVNTGSRMVFAGAGEITLSQATAAGASTISISAPAQTTQTQGILSAGASNLGNTAGNTTVNTGSRLVFVGTNMVSLSQTTGAGATTLSINATQSVQTQDVLSAGVSNVGNTAGNTTVNTGSRLVFAGGNNITLSQSTAAGATTITVSAPNLGAGAMSAGVSTGGNTAGATGITGTQLVLVGSDNITLSQTTGANGGTVSIIGGGGGGFSAGMSTEGNTAGNTGVTGTRLVLVGSGPVSLSQTTGAAGGTLSINAPATSSLSATGILSISTNGSTISIGVPGTAADWQNFPQGLAALQTHIASVSKTPLYWHENLPLRITANSVVFRISMVTASQPLSLSAHMGIYTKVNSTSMALLGSFSEAYVVSSASSVSFSGIRNLVMTGIGTHTALSVLQPGNYGIGMMFSATATNAMNASLMGASTANGPLGILLPGTNSMSTGTSQGAQALWGRGSTTVNAMPANVSRPDLINQGSGASMQLHPWIYIRS